MGTILLLKNKMCNEGILDFDFYAKDLVNGYQGVVFRYLDSSYFYTLEFHNNKVRLR